MTAAAAIEQEFDLRPFFAILKRRALYLLLPAAAVFGIVCAAAYLIPPVYQASATILVESQQIPTDLAAPTVTASATERIQVIQQRLMTRDNLLEIVRKFELYPDERRRRSPTEMVDVMRETTNIEQIDIGEPRPAANTTVIGFTVSFDYHEPTIASRVANQFVALILEQNIQSRTRRAAETSKFFEGQLAELREKLTNLEGRIAEFKNKNEDALPDSLAYRRTLLLQLQSELADIDRKVAFAQAQRQALSLSKEQGQAFRIQRLNIRHETLKRQLAFAVDERNSLKPLLEKGIIAKNRILELDRSVAALEGEIQAVQADIEAAAAEANESETEIGELQAQRSELAKRASALNESILRTPEVEAGLTALVRDHESTRVQYHEAQAKMGAAATGEDLEEDRQAERFEVIEQASPPTEPVWPDRPRIILAGSFGSVALGAGLVILLEMLDKTIRTSADLERRLQIRAISTIPYVTTRRERIRKRFILVISLVAAIAVVAGVLAAIHIFYLPLDLLLERLRAYLGL